MGPWSQSRGLSTFSVYVLAQRPHRKGVVVFNLAQATATEGKGALDTTNTGVVGSRQTLHLCLMLCPSMLRNSDRVGHTRANGPFQGTAVGVHSVVVG